MYKELSFFSSNSTDQGNVTFSLRASPYVDRFKILRVSIPLSYETTDSSNNSLAYLDKNGNKQVVRIPSGNYNASSFTSNLQNSLGGNFTVTYNEVSRTVTINNPDNFTI